MYYKLDITLDKQKINCKINFDEIQLFAADFVKSSLLMRTSNLEVI